MKISDYIPSFLLNKYRMYKVYKQHGDEGNVFSTYYIHPSAELGHHIYLARSVEVRERVQIDNYSYCSEGAILFAGVSIGKFCSIGYKCQIGLPNHPLEYLSTSPAIYRNKQINEKIPCMWPTNDISAPPTIGNDVWIGSNACIMQGVTIGNGAVVAAGAIVTKNVPPYAIVGGVPAKVIRYRFDEKTIDKLQKAEWWNHDVCWISDHISELINK